MTPDLIPSACLLAGFFIGLVMHLLILRLSDSEHAKEIALLKSEHAADLDKLAFEIMRERNLNSIIAPIALHAISRN